MQFSKDGFLARVGRLGDKPELLNQLCTNFRAELPEMIAVAREKLHELFQEGMPEYAEQQRLRDFIQIADRLKPKDYNHLLLSVLVASGWTVSASPENLINTPRAPRTADRENVKLVLEQLEPENAIQDFAFWIAYDRQSSAAKITIQHALTFANIAHLESRRPENFHQEDQTISGD